MSSLQNHIIEDFIVDTIKGANNANRITLEISVVNNTPIKMLNEEEIDLVHQTLRGLMTSNEIKDFYYPNLINNRRAYYIIL